MTPSPKDRSLIALGRAVNELRKEKGLTQEELAEEVDLHESYISFIESGQRNPTWGTIRGISRGLGVSLGELMRKVEEIERKG